MIASPQGCTLGLDGPEPSGTFIHQGQHFFALFVPALPPGH